jgi:hydroxypyruvate isomerase
MESSFCEPYMNKLQFSATEWSFFKTGFPPEDFYRRLVQIGIGAVEMAPEERWTAAKKAGLKLLNIAAPGMTNGLNRVENHDSLLPTIAEMITDAGDNQIAQIVVFSGNRVGQSDCEGKENCEAGLRELAPLAEKSGVTLILEMLCTNDHPDYQADRSSFGFDVARAINSPAVKVLYDIYHMHWMEEDVMADITENLDLIAHIHVAEKNKRSKPVAHGGIDYSSIFKKINDAGYCGYWGLEFIPQGNPLEELKEAVDLFRSFT